MNTRNHRKLVVEQSAVGLDAYAYFYRFGPCSGLTTPLVVYFGGAISTHVYHARRDTEPLPLVEIFEDALSRACVEYVDLLVVACPLIGRAVPAFRARMFELLLGELLPRSPNPKSERVAFFGNSEGAHIAAVLAFELEAVLALATTAAVGLAEAADESERRLFAGKRYLSFADVGDPCSKFTHAFWEAMILRGIPVDVIEREGGHDFEDYVANGSAREAFGRLLDCLARKA